MATVLETCRVSPPPRATDDLSVPLSFFDLKWLHFHLIRRLLFYDCPCPKVDFVDIVVPKLKQSLSLTLKHYLPVAGNLIYPLDTQKKPVIRYVVGDSVTLTIAESQKDFDELVGNQARDADQFYDFIPQIQPAIDESDHKLVNLIAVQITLFPGRGICVGFANHHCLGDANSITRFILAWASINKLGGDEEFLTEKGESLPNFGRSFLKDTLETDARYWKILGQIPLNPPSSFPIPTSRVRATFILTQADINKLKGMVLAYKPSLVRVSSFIVTTAYVWTCLVKSGDAAGEKVADDESEVCFIIADARGRENALINPPVPTNYFGNCLGGGVVDIEHKKIVGEEGFLITAEAIAGEIKNRVNNKDEFLKGPENWISNRAKSQSIRAFGVSGSPNFHLPDADFGWGKARKLEVVSMDGEKYSMSLCKCRDSNGGLEVGLSLPKERMNVFAAIFANGLSS